MNISRLGEIINDAHETLIGHVMKIDINISEHGNENLNHWSVTAPQRVHRAPCSHCSLNQQGR